MYKEHETPQTFIAPSKPGEESTQSGTVTKEAGREMNQWIRHHLQCPFLTKAGEEYFMTKYGITRRQVKTGFNNRRQRIIAPMRSVKQNELQHPILSLLAAFGVTVPFLQAQTNGQ
jgi:hypothetical protein